MSYDPELETAVEDLHQTLLRRYPDPVDVFEDDLARELGLERHPHLSLAEWRRARVRFIDAHDPE